jgi:RHS repeat-associated protein
MSATTNFSEASYYRARYYDSTAGRFLSGDPIGFEGSLNYYRYVFNNPALLADPAGLFPTCVSTTSGIACQSDLSAIDLQKSLVKALFPGSVPQGASLILPIPCQDAKKILDNSLSYYTGHFWDGNPNGWDTWRVAHPECLALNGGLPFRFFFLKRWVRSSSWRRSWLRFFPIRLAPTETIHPLY